MSNTHFSSICKVLSELWIIYRDEAQNHQEWRDFFVWADVGLPLAYMKNENMITGIKDNGKQIIEDTWKVFCEMISIDPEADYDGILAAWEASPNGPAKPIDNS